LGVRLGSSRGPPCTSVTSTPGRSCSSTGPAAAAAAVAAYRVISNQCCAVSRCGHVLCSVSNVTAQRPLVCWQAEQMFRT
jgi:hypothetical protein